MNELTQNIEKEKHRINKILSFSTGEYIDMPITNRADPNSKTITTSTIQGGVRTTTTRLRPVRKLIAEEELDRVLSPSVSGIDSGYVSAFVNVANIALNCQVFFVQEGGFNLFCEVAPFNGAELHYVVENLPPYRIT